MRNDKLDPIVREEIIYKDYISKGDMYRLYPCGFNQISEMFKTIEKKLIEENKSYFSHTRPVLLPIDEVLAIYPLDIEKIKKAANKKRKIIRENS